MRHSICDSNHRSSPMGTSQGKPSNSSTTNSPGVQGVSSPALQGLSSPPDQAKLTAEFKSKFSKYDAKELSVLDSLFRELASRSAGPTMDKATFLRFFSMPGMLGERLFQVFDRRQNGVIEWEEFVAGLADFCRGTMDEKILLLFRMYDLTGDGHVSREEFRTMLYSLLTPASELLQQQHHDADDVDAALTFESGSGDSETKSTVETLVTRVFDDNQNELDAQGGLDFVAFKKFISQTPDVIQMMESVMARHAWTPLDARDQELNNAEAQLMLACENCDWRCVYCHECGNELSEDATNASFLVCNKCGVTIGGRHGNFRFCMMCGRTLLPTRVPPSPAIKGLSLSPVPVRPGKQSMPTSPVHSPQVEDASAMHLSLAPLSLQSSAANSAAPTPLLTGADGPTASPGPNQSTVPVAPGSKFMTRAVRTSSATDLNADGAITAADRTTSFSLGADEETHCEGWLAKKGRLLQQFTDRYYVCRAGFLYAFKNKEDVQPYRVTFLEGCFIDEPVEDQYASSGYYGIEIKSIKMEDPTQLADKPKGSASAPAQTGKEVEHITYLFARSIEKRREWIRTLRKGAKSVPFEDHYTQGVRIGRGRFSTVYECRNTLTGEHAAVKVVEKASLDNREAESLRTEIAILKLVNHPNIMRLREVFETRTHLYIVMKLVRGGDLFQRIKKKKCYPEDMVRQMVWSLLSAVRYLHSRGIVHRDIKPENILCLDEFDDTKIMISDFGLSKFATPAELMKIACGTLCYVAPEVLKLTGYSFSVDVWSIGVIMYLLLRGRLPFDGKTKDEIIDRTLTGAPDFTHPSWKQVSPDAIHLINQLLQKDPNQRISCEKARQHPWFESIRAQKTQAAAVAAAAAATAPLELTPAIAGTNARHPEHLQLGLLRAIPAQHALYSPDVGGVSANVYSSHFADVPADRPNSQQSILAAAGQRP